MKERSPYEAPPWLVPALIGRLEKARDAQANMGHDRLAVLLTETIEHLLGATVARAGLRQVAWMRETAHGPLFEVSVTGEQRARFTPVFVAADARPGSQRAPETAKG